MLTIHTKDAPSTPRGSLLGLQGLKEAETADIVMFAGKRYKVDISFATLFEVQKNIGTITQAGLLRTLGLPMQLAPYCGQILGYLLLTPRFPAGVRVDGAPPVFCMQQDFDLVYANFMQYYNINLFKTDITWFEFNFLLENILNTDNSLTRRIEARRPTYDKNDTPEQRRQKHELQAKYSLRNKDAGTLSEEEKQKAISLAHGKIEEAFKNHGKNVEAE